MTFVGPILGALVSLWASPIWAIALDAFMFLCLEQRLRTGPGGTGVLLGAVGLGALCAMPAASGAADTDRADIVLLSVMSLQ